MEDENLSLRRNILKGSFWTFLTTLLSRFGGIIFMVIAARLLMPEGFGIYSLALSVGIIFATFADLGINNALVKFVASEIDKNRRKASAYFRYIFKIKLIVTLIASLAFLTLAYPLAYFLFKKPELFKLFLILTIYVTTTSFEGFFVSLFYVKNKTNYTFIKESIFQTARVIILISILYLISRNQYVVGTILSLVIASVISLFIVLFFYKKSFIFPIEKDTISINKSGVLKFIGFLTLTSLAGVFFSYIDTVMIGIFLSPKYIGYYKASITLIIAIAGIMSFPGVFLATLTKVKEKNVQLSFDKILKVLIIFAIPSIAGLIVLSRQLLVLIFGYEYIEGAVLLIILSPIIFFFITTSLFLSLLSAKEKIKEIAFLTLITTVINIILNYLLIISFLRFSEFSASKGVALATLISWFIYFIGGIIILRVKMNVKFRLKFMTKPFFASLVMAFLIFFYNHYFPQMSLLKGMVEIFLGAVFYFGFLFISRDITKETIKIFYKDIRSLFKGPS